MNALRYIPVLLVLSVLAVGSELQAQPYQPRNPLRNDYTLMSAIADSVRFTADAGGTVTEEQVPLTIQTRPDGAVSAVLVGRSPVPKPLVEAAVAGVRTATFPASSGEQRYLFMVGFNVRNGDGGRDGWVHVWQIEVDTRARNAKGCAGSLILISGSGARKFHTPKESSSVSRKSVGGDTAGSGIVDPSYDQAGLMRRIVYPELARRCSIEGQTLVNVLIDKSGDVIRYHITRPSGSSLLDRSAVDAVLDTPFSPARKDGKPVALWLQLPVTFRLY